MNVSVAFLAWASSALFTMKQENPCFCVFSNVYVWVSGTLRGKTHNRESSRYKDKGVGLKG